MSRSHARYERMRNRPDEIVGVTMFGDDDPADAVTEWLRRCECPSVIEQHRGMPTIVRVLHKHQCPVVRALRRSR